MIPQIYERQTTPLIPTEQHTVWMLCFYKRIRMVIKQYYSLETFLYSSGDAHDIKYITFVSCSPLFFFITRLSVWSLLHTPTSTRVVQHAYCLIINNFGWTVMLYELNSLPPVGIESIASGKLNSDVLRWRASIFVRIRYSVDIIIIGFSVLSENRLMQFKKKKNYCLLSVPCKTIVFRSLSLFIIETRYNSRRYYILLTLCVALTCPKFRTVL